MVIAIALPRLNDLGHLLTPFFFILMDHFLMDLFLMDHFLHHQILFFAVLSIRAGSRPKQPATGQSLAGYFRLT